MSRQALHQALARKRQTPDNNTDELLLHVKQLRKTHHAAIGCRKLYVVIQKDTAHCHLLNRLGRRAFEQLLISKKLGSPLCKHRLTKVKHQRFANGLVNKDINGINQVWVSDTTYYPLNQQWNYLTTVLDYYSREVLAIHVSQSLTTQQTTIAALQQAIAYRKGQDLSGCMVHSDGGTQYKDTDFVALLANNNMVSSMAKIVFENTVSERFNATIKQEYLAMRPPENLAQLINLAKYIIVAYNTIRPHESMKYLTPQQYAQQQMALPLQQRTTLRAWTMEAALQQKEKMENEQKQKITPNRNT